MEQEQTIETYDVQDEYLTRVTSNRKVLGELEATIRWETALATSDLYRYLLPTLILDLTSEVEYKMEYPLAPISFL